MRIRFFAALLTCAVGTGAAPALAQTGACCFEVAGLTDCAAHTEDACTAMGGNYQGDGVSCNAPGLPCSRGACCGGTSCSQEFELPCTKKGYFFIGVGEPCPPDDCGATGACCLSGGDPGEVGGCASFVDESTCDAVGGLWWGPGLHCDDFEVITNCGPGACCFDPEVGACTTDFEADCREDGGVYLGHGLVCTGIGCEVEPIEDPGPDPCGLDPDDPIPGAGCDAGPFIILGSVEASDHPAILGAPITTDGVFYQHFAGTTNPPQSVFIPQFPGLEFDSYIALDGANANGMASPSTASYTANATITALPTEFAQDTLKINAAFSMPGTGIQSTFRADLGHQVVFFARLTVSGGSGAVHAPSVIVNFAAASGGLAEVELTDCILDAADGPGTGSYFILVDQTTVQIDGITEPCAADVDASGAVNSVDLNIILANFGEQTSEGDTNGDGLVNSTDLNTVLADFGFTGECPVTLTVNDLYIARSCLPP